MAEPFIRCEGVTFCYGGEKEEHAALNGVDLEIRAGEFVAILGHNGSGKSTLAKHLNAILLPTAGRVTVDGIDTADETRTFELRSRVGMVFQNPDNQLVATVVEEDVAFGPENLGVPSAEIRRRVDAALDAVGMRSFARHAPHKLSGGQKQRVAIAGVLAMNPRCIVLDEPTAMLDPKGRRQVMDTVVRLSRERGITVILITHFMEEAALCDRVVVMNDGTVALDGTPKEVFRQRQQLLAMGLTVPAITELCFQLHEAGVPIAPDLLGQQECLDALSALLSQKSLEEKTCQSWK